MLKLCALTPCLRDSRTAAIRPESGLSPVAARPGPEADCVINNMVVNRYFMVVILSLNFAHDSVADSGIRRCQQDDTPAYHRVVTDSGLFDIFGGCFAGKFPEGTLEVRLGVETTVQGQFQQVGIRLLIRPLASKGCPPGVDVFTEALLLTLWTPGQARGDGTYHPKRRYLRSQTTVLTAPNDAR